MSTKKQKREKLLKAKEEESRRKLKYATAESLISIFVIALLFFAWGSHLIPITDPVESNYALTAKEMVLSGDWMSPQIYGRFWFDKPIMVYWMIALSYTVFGFTDFASRFPAAICGAMTVTILIWYIRRITKNNVVAVWSGVMLGTSLAFWIISHAIITDSMLMLFTIPTLLSAYIGLTENNKQHMILAYAAAGLACLSKGPVGLVLPGLLLLFWCGWMRQKEYFFRLFPWQGILAFLITVLPWYGGMYILHGNDFITEFLGLHNIVRATASEHPEDNHFYYYFVLLPLTLLPWTGLFFYELKAQWKEKTPFYKFLVVWVLGTLIFYTLMATKYITYTYIAMAPAAILASFAAPKVSDGEKIPGLAATIPFFLLLSVLLAGTFFIPDAQWWVFYIAFAYAVWALLFRWNKNAHIRLTIISTVTASSLLVVIMSGLPIYLSSRSTVDMAEYMHNLPGKHYFFRSYPASFSYYTGETATRLIPVLPNEKKRDSRWNDKYAMPSMTEEDFKNQKMKGPVYMYVSKSNLNKMSEWSLSNLFTAEMEFNSGTIFKMVAPHD